MQLQLNKLSSLQLLQVLRFGALFLSSVFIARLVADTHLVGEYENLVLIGSSFTFFWVSGLINTFIPFYQSVSATQTRNFISTTFILLSTFAFVFGVIVFLFKPFLFDGKYADFSLYLIFAFFGAPAFLTEYIYLSINKVKSIAIYAVIISGLHLACVFLPLWLGYGMFGVLICLAASGVLRYIFCAFLVLKISGGFSFDSALAKTFLKAGLPVAGSLLIGGSMLYIDSYIVRFNFDTTQFAIFQYGARELPFVLLMANALSNVGSAELASHHSKGNILTGLYYLKSKSLRLMHFLFPISLILLIFSEPLFKYLYAPTYIPAAHIFDVYVLLIISRLIFPQTILLAIHQNKKLLWATAFEWIIKIGLNIWFLYIFGLPGIAYATVLAYLSEKLIHIYFLRKENIYINQFIPVKTWLFYSSMLVSAFILKAFFA
ncbi:MAG: hypothetical protein ACXWEY_16100 [Bacteroidia bacterium]